MLRSVFPCKATGAAAASTGLAEPVFLGVSMEESRSVGSRPTLKHLVEAYERHVIEDALWAASGNQRRAARALGVLPTTLHEKMKRLGLLRRAGPVAAEPTEAMALAG